jgi:fatty-acid desaturase
LKSYNVIGYSIIALTCAAGAALAPPAWGPLVGASVAVAYLFLIWFFGGLYLSDVMHMGIAHKTLDYRPGFVKLITVFWNTAGIYINPTTWVNRHRHHHAFSDHVGDPNKLSEDGFWKTLYLCLFPYPCRSNLAKDEILKSGVLRLTSTLSFEIFSQFSSYALLWLLARDWKYALMLWLTVRVFALWVNMIQNYWTHDRRFGTRRYDDDDDNAMNLGDWLPVTASFSASLQNNHHHFPHFMRTSHDDREYDFGLITVRAMMAMGLVKPSSSGAKIPAGIVLQGRSLPVRQTSHVGP